MEDLEQENGELREEVIALRDSLEKLKNMVEALEIAQNQPREEPQRTVISEVMSTPIIEVCASDPRYAIPPNRPWSMPLKFVPEGYVQPSSEEPGGYKPLGVEVQQTTNIPGGYKPQDVNTTKTKAVIVPPPLVHVTPQHGEQTFHPAPTESAGVYERLDEFQEQFMEMQKELKALRGHDLFGKNAADLCLVPGSRSLTSLRYQTLRNTKAILALKVT